MGLAFGTGEHPTTALCLEWLERHFTSGTTLLDYGCGSGILALAALALGADRAFAVDNDGQALLATRANAALNGVTERLFVGAPEALPDVTRRRARREHPRGPARRRSRATFAQRVQPGGWLVLSGILERASGARRGRLRAVLRAPRSRPCATAGFASRRAGMRVNGTENR